jgi:hypothetical protein
MKEIANGGVLELTMERYRRPVTKQALVYSRVGTLS